MRQLDLTPFLARGFGRSNDMLIANISVEGIDKYHAYSQIRLTSETAGYLYNEYTSLSVKYYNGSRPMLEKIIDCLGLEKETSEKEKIVTILNWTALNVKHATYVAHETPGNRGMTEEELIASGWGWCNEKARIFVSLAKIAGFPARMCSLFHMDNEHGHMTAEVYVDKKWSFVDPTSATVIVDPGTGEWTSAMELSQEKRLNDKIDSIYHENIVNMCKIHGDRKSYIDSIWFKDNPYKMFFKIGITNYPIFTFPQL